jgi:hypothetical protein
MGFGALLGSGSNSSDNVYATGYHITTTGEQITVTQVGPDSYDVRSVSPHSGGYHSFTVDGATVGSILSNGMPVSHTHFISEDEVKELESLEEEVKAWERQQKLVHFKELPRHIRQNIVDEACIKVMLQQMNNVDTSKFEGWARLEELKNKRNIVRGVTLTAVNGSIYMGHDYTYKYNGITSEFSKEELIDAHAEATIEEDMLNN